MSFHQQIKSLQICALLFTNSFSIDLADRPSDHLRNSVLLSFLMAIKFTSNHGKTCLDFPAFNSAVTVQIFYFISQWWGDLISKKNSFTDSKAYYQYRTYYSPDSDLMLSYYSSLSPNLETANLVNRAQVNEMGVVSIERQQWVLANTIISSISIYWNYEWSLLDNLFYDHES